MHYDLEDEILATEEKPEPRGRSQSHTLSEELSAIRQTAWFSRLNTVVDDVRKKGEAALEQTKRELQDLGQDISQMRSTESGGSTTSSSSVLNYLHKTVNVDKTEVYLNKWSSELSKAFQNVVVVSAPTDEPTSTEVLFEEGRGPDTQPKRRIHMSRREAQIHLLNTTMDNFLQDPTDQAAFASFRSSFSADQQTQAITNALNERPDLRRTMESIVPDTVSYF